MSAARTVRRALVMALAGSILAGATSVLAAPAARTRLDAYAGPGFAIGVTKGGKKVTRLRAGAVRIVVRDLAANHNFRLTGPGVNRSTSVPARTTKTWDITLRKGSYTFVCDEHPQTMIGRIKVV